MTPLARVRLAALAAAACAAAALAAPPGPVPPPADADRARAELAAAFGKARAAAKDAKAHRALAAEFARLAKEDARPAARYVLLRAAIEEATAGGDVRGGLAAADALAAEFDLPPADGFHMRADLLREGAKVASPNDTALALDLLNAALKVADGALLADEPEAAARALAAGEKVAAAAGTKKKDLAAPAKRLAAWKGFPADLIAAAGRRALDGLKTEPNDPALNAAAGRYACLGLGDWPRGLPLLAKGADGLAAAAKRDLGGATVVSPDALAGIGDAWWAAAEAEKPGSLARANAQGRAAFWYERAAPGLKGLGRVRTDQRLEQSADTRRAGRQGMPEVVAVKPPPPPPPPADGWVSLFDGKSLDGWTPTSDGVWAVKDGAIVGDAAARNGGYLVWKSPVTDFDLRAEVMVTENGDGGIWFRCTPDGGRMKTGYELQIRDTTADATIKGKTGALYRHTDGKYFYWYHSNNPARPNEWATLELAADGFKLTSTVNGTRLLAPTDKEEIYAAGSLALEVRKGAVLKVRKIEIRPKAK